MATLLDTQKVKSCRIISFFFKILQIFTGDYQIFIEKAILDEGTIKIYISEVNGNSREKGKMMLGPAGAGLPLPCIWVKAKQADVLMTDKINRNYETESV